MNTFAAMTKRQLALALLALACLLAPDARAQTTDQLKQQLDGVGVVERLGETAALERSFVDETGRTTTLGAFTGKPLLLTFNYTRCATLCSLQLSGVAKALKGLKAHELGEDFEVVTLLIDPTETTPRASRARDIYVGQAGGNDARTGGWHFLTGTDDALRAAAASVGVSYRYDEDAKEYRHQATLIVLTPDGRVSSYLHGIGYEPDKLQEALERAARSEVLTEDQQTSLGGFLLNCFGFDGSGNAPMGLVVMRIGGAVVMVFLFGLLGHYGLRDWRRRRTRRAT
jgi:protein SCO1/2